MQSIIRENYIKTNRSSPLRQVSLASDLFGSEYVNISTIIITFVLIGIKFYKLTNLKYLYIYDHLIHFKSHKRTITKIIV